MTMSLRAAEAETMHALHAATIITGTPCVLSDMVEPALLQVTAALNQVVIRIRDTKGVSREELLIRNRKIECQSQDLVTSAS